MDKSYGEKNLKYIKKDKVKKQKYANHRNKCSLHKSKRNYVNSRLNCILNNQEVLDEFIYPSNPPNTYTWWDCAPSKPKVFKFMF